MKKREDFKRFLLFVVGLFFSALGVAFTKNGTLGVSPVSSVPNILSLRFTELTMGDWLIVWNIILVIAQVLILRCKFKPIQLLQIPVSFAFGWFTDLGMLLVSVVPVNNYITRLLFVVLGVIILGFGISLTVIADVIMNAGEAFVKTVSDVSGKKFGNIKILFDVSCVAFSIILSLLFFDFKLLGTREGTLIASFGTGAAVKFFTARLHEPLNKMLKK